MGSVLTSTVHLKHRHIGSRKARVSQRQADDALLAGSVGRRQAARPAILIDRHASNYGQRAGAAASVCT